MPAVKLCVPLCQALLQVLMFFMHYVTQSCVCFFFNVWHFGIGRLSTKVMVEVTECHWSLRSARSLALTPACLDLTPVTEGHESWGFELFLSSILPGTKRNNPNALSLIIMELRKLLAFEELKSTSILVPKQTGRGTRSCCTRHIHNTRVSSHAMPARLKFSDFVKWFRHADLWWKSQPHEY